MSTTITSIPADATTVLYNDGGSDIGTGSTTNATLGKAVDFVNNVGENASTEPAKRFYKYARPWRWSSSVVVVPALMPARSSTPTTDGGFISGHTAEGVRKALAIAYLVPQRYQEMVARALEMGENRILAGMHSPLDVIGGRIQGQAAVAAAIATGSNKGDLKSVAYQQAQSVMSTAAGVSTPEALFSYAHAGTAANDRFTDLAAMRADAARRLSFNLPGVGDATKAAVVPKGAEVLLETRLPYLDAAQRRVVLKTTALPSGSPLVDDAEGWGRVNLFAAADGYGAFNGDVVVAMDATKGGFHAIDAWRNNIGGAGKLTKQGTGTLRLSGTNVYSGGTQLDAGTLSAESVAALGKGDVFLTGGTLASKASAPLGIAGRFSQRAAASLQVQAGANGAGKLLVTGDVAIESGAKLTVKFAAGYTPKAGDTIELISTSGLLAGRYGSLTVDGFSKVTPTYGRNSLSVRLDG